MPLETLFTSAAFEVIVVGVVSDRIADRRHTVTDGVSDEESDEESFEQTDHHCGELEAQPGTFLR